jgi:hypothetical protein
MPPLTARNPVVSYNKNLTNRQSYDLIAFLAVDKLRDSNQNGNKKAETGGKCETAVRPVSPKPDGANRG